MQRRAPNRWDERPQTPFKSPKSPQSLFRGGRGDRYFNPDSKPIRSPRFYRNYHLSALLLCRLKISLLAYGTDRGSLKRLEDVIAFRECVFAAASPAKGVQHETRDPFSLAGS